MNKLISIALFSLTIFNNYSKAQELPAKDTVIKQMMVANKYFMDKWPDPSANIVTDKVRPSNLWTRATYYEGLMALYYLNRDTTFYKYAVDWGESHDWEPTYVSFTRNADNMCCGQIYIELYLLDNQPERIQPIKACVDSMVKSPISDDWWWIDALQMAMPVFAKFGALFNDTAYFRKMHDLYNHTKTIEGDSGLYNATDHLWWRDRNFDPPYHTPSGKYCYWSRGNGWVFAALTRVLDVMPTDAPNHEEYVNDFKNMAEALAEVQRTDGFWNPSLVDPLDFGGKETSGTAFFTYGLAWGINHQLLDEETYKPIVTNAWNGMINDALHPNGFLGYVQGSGSKPSDGQPLSYNKAPNFEDFGLGAFLLAGSEVYHLAPDSAIISDLKTPDISENAITIYPNPATDLINIQYTLTSNSAVNITLYDMQGNPVKMIFDNPEQSPGKYTLSCQLTSSNGGTLFRGIYFIRMAFSDKILLRKIVLVN